LPTKEWQINISKKGSKQQTHMSIQRGVKPFRGRQTGHWRLVMFKYAYTSTIITLSCQIQRGFVVYRSGKNSMFV